MKTYTRTADGTPVDEFTATSPNGVLRDGFTVHTKMLLMDSQPSTPDNVAAREARAVRMESQWKNPTPPVTVLPKGADRETRIQNAWR